MGRVGVAIPRTVWSARSEQFYTQVLRGLEDASLACGNAVVSQVVHTPEQELAILEDWAKRGSVDIVVLKDLGQDDPRPPRMRALGMPYVIIGDVKQRDLGPGVLSDNTADMTRLLSVLVGEGHREIGHVCGPLSLLHSQWRREAYLAFVDEQGSARHIWTGDYSAESGARALDQILLEDPVPTAIVLDNDVMAIGALRRARQHGVKVPEELSIIAWDDSLACQLHDPPLAVLAHVPHQIGLDAGHLAAELLDRPSRRRSVEYPSAVLLPRGTMAAPVSPPVPIAARMRPVEES